MNLPADLQDRAASLRISPQRLTALLACGSDSPPPRWDNSPPATRGPNHHIRRHPRMRSYYIVIRHEGVNVRINGTESIVETRRIRDDYLRSIGRS